MQTEKSAFDENWKILIDCLRSGPATINSWYKIKSGRIFL